MIFATLTTDEEVFMFQEGFLVTFLTTAVAFSSLDVNDASAITFDVAYEIVCILGFY